MDLITAVAQVRYRLQRRRQSGQSCETGHVWQVIRDLFPKYSEEQRDLIFQQVMP